MKEKYFLTSIVCFLLIFNIILAYIQNIKNFDSILIFFLVFPALIFLFLEDEL